jgi:hypothetical protein
MSRENDYYIEEDYNEDCSCGHPCGAEPLGCPTCNDRGKNLTKEDYLDIMLGPAYDPDLDDS